MCAQGTVRSVACGDGNKLPQRGVVARSLLQSSFFSQTQSGRLPRLKVSLSRRLCRSSSPLVDTLADPDRGSLNGPVCHSRWNSVQPTDTTDVCHRLQTGMCLCHNRPRKNHLLQMTHPSECGFHLKARHSSQSAAECTRTHGFSSPTPCLLDRTSSCTSAGRILAREDRRPFLVGGAVILVDCHANVRFRLCPGNRCRSAPATAEWCYACRRQ
ncbi:hypothetical protein CSUI_000580 [Cystoisospora suis]|uniref:Uncharacterized protein n=1 Tax=Cystoisospora suis TaxID=483139 RepID=A0A2C6LF01_9APIC|nr:hypothetical protein CSUI_000580 [Cystoisospora suis]